MNSESSPDPRTTRNAERGQPRRRCNSLEGKGWLLNSLSVWSDIRKSAEEARLNHPALFPQMLVERLIETFLPPEGNTILDPFAGSGSTILAAAAMGKRGIGLELSPEYVRLARQRLSAVSGDSQSASRVTKGESRIIHDSARHVLRHVAAGSVDLCITSPPYWNILTRKRTADYKAVRHYGHNDGDLGTMASYAEFLDSLAEVFRQILEVLRAGAYCCVIVMDLRKKNRFFPFHSDVASRLVELGFVYDDLIIWNRQAEYNNLRPLGYPSVFRVNKVHEFILIMQKPRRA